MCFFIFRNMQEESFFNAIRKGHLEEIEQALEVNPQLVHIKDQRGSTPLILASYYDHGSIVASLLNHGARIDDTDGVGNTALMGVCFKGYLELADQLIKAGANVNTTNTMGASCLIFAITFNQPEIAKLLIVHGADINIKDARGNTALDHAKTQGFSHFEDILSGE